MSIIQSSERILAYVDEANLKIGDQLPAEIDLAKVLGMSRNSVREAYAKLTARGVLVRRHGIGTFLAKPQILNDFAHRSGFWQMIDNAGFQPSLRLISDSLSTRDDEMAMHLVPPVQDRGRRLEWLFLADDVPVVFLQHAISQAIRLDHIDWSKVNTLLTALGDRINAVDAEPEVMNTAVNASADVARYLHMPKGAAVLHGLAKVHAGDGTIPIVSRHWSNPEYTAITQRKPLAGDRFDPSV